MKLLIITQTVDRNDPVLGFFHKWIAEFSDFFESVVVICLNEREHDLPPKVKILSLGKEKELSKLSYIMSFYRYVWLERNSYDAIFVHMNQEYVLLGGLLWKFMGKRVTMWRNHSKGSFLTDIAVFICDRVFCTSEYSYTARFRKTIIMPVGIDTGIFKRDFAIQRKKGGILYVGRVDPIKKVDVLIRALKVLDREGADFSCYVYGPSSSKEYYASMEELASPLVKKGKIVFAGSLSNEKMASVYNQYDISVNLTAKGSFDKTIMEHMACEGISLFSNDSMKKYLDVKDYNILRFDDGDSMALSHKLRYFMNISDDEKIKLGKRLRLAVERNHSLKQLSKELAESVSV